MARDGVTTIRQGLRKDLVISAERQRRAAARAKKRANLRHAAFTRGPLWLTGGRLLKNKSVCHINSVERTIPLPELPEALDGLRITHLSDLHVGSLLPCASLPGIMASANAMGGDLIAVTGDFVDLSLDVLDEVIDALLRLQAPLGVYLVPGNHDYLDDGPQLIARMRAAGLTVLLNEQLTLEHHGAKVQLAGIDWAARPEELEQLVHQTVTRCPARRQCGVRLLLSHHPDAFDAACKHGVDLTLSGHTHGGQFTLANNRGKRGSIGLGSLAFRYPRGLYRRGDQYLYVTTGIGSWFPLRIRCPAEIAQLRLTSSPENAGESSHP